MKIDKDWIIHIALWLFAAGGAYFMLKDHDRRITKIEDSKFVSKDDFNERLRDLRWNRTTTR